MSLPLAARHRNNKARCLHVTDISSPAERCMFWLDDYRRAREALAEALRYPSMFDAAQHEDDMAYAAAAFRRDREAMRGAFRIEAAMREHARMTFQTQAAGEFA